MIAGLEEISEGVLEIDGRPVNDLPAKDRDIAFVFQNYALYPHLTVAANIAFGLDQRRAHRSALVAAVTGNAAARRAEQAEIDARVAEVSRTLGLDALLSRFPRELSGGQRQRVAVGRAIARKPKVFLFDEPLSNLDARLRIETRTELRELHRRLAATIVYVTHDQEEAMTLADRLVVMHRGRVQQNASAQECYERPANRFVAGFIGTPPMNIVDGRAGGDRFEANGVAVGLGGRWVGEHLAANSLVRCRCFKLRGNKLVELCPEMRKGVAVGANKTCPYSNTLLCDRRWRWRGRRDCGGHELRAFANANPAWHAGFPDQGFCGELALLDHDMQLINRVGSRLTATHSNVPMGGGRLNDRRRRRGGDGRGFWRRMC